MNSKLDHWIHSSTAFAATLSIVIAVGGLASLATVAAFVEQGGKDVAFT
jgi:hypothetical protein